MSETCSAYLDITPAEVYSSLLHTDALSALFSVSTDALIVACFLGTLFLAAELSK